MRNALGRRALIMRGLSAAVATTVGLIGGRAQAQSSTGTAGSDLDGALPSRFNDVRATVGKLLSSAGATLIGFERHEDAAVASTVQRKLSEASSIADFGAIADDRTDNAPAIQRAIDTVHAAGGGSLLIPAGIFRIAKSVQLRSLVKLQGTGPSSVLHFDDDTRASALRGDGEPTARLSRITIRDVAITGDARFTKGKPNRSNGSGIVFVHADDCDLTGVHVLGFADNGIAFLNGSRNSVMDCRVEQTAQGISFTASNVTVTGNIAIGNRILSTGEYNGLHLEGGFGGGDRRGEVRYTTLSGNTISDTWETGINIELAPYTSCVGNTVQKSGQGQSNNDMGIKVFGGYRSAICGNCVVDSKGEGILIGANSSECIINGNSTAGNNHCLVLSDSGGTAVSNDVAIGFNSFTEGDVRTSGNVRIRNRTEGLSFTNRAVQDPVVLDHYQERRFLPVVDSGSSVDQYLVQEGHATRIGNVVHLAIRVAWVGRLRAAEIAIGGLADAAVNRTLLVGALRSSASNSDMLRQVVATASERQVRIFPPFSSAGDTRQTLELLASGHYIVAD